MDCQHDPCENSPQQPVLIPSTAEEKAGGVFLCNTSSTMLLNMGNGSSGKGPAMIAPCEVSFTPRKEIHGQSVKKIEQSKYLTE